MGDGRLVLVVEPDHLLRELLAIGLEQHGYSVDTAATAADAERCFARGDHDAVALDVDLGAGQGGIELAERLRVSAPSVGLVFLTNLPDARFVGRSPESLPPGVAYIRKQEISDVTVLVRALDAVIRGLAVEGLRQDRDPRRPLSGLTRKQIAVLALVASGKSNAQIAQERGVSVKAVEDTIRRAAQAMGIDGQQQGNLRVAAARRYWAATMGAPVVQIGSTSAR